MYFHIIGFPCNFTYFILCIKDIIGFPGESVVKNPPANTGDVGWIPRSGSFTGGGNGTHSRILAWKIPWTQDTCRLQSMGWQKSQTRLSDWTRTKGIVLRKEPPDCQRSLRPKSVKDLLLKANKLIGLSLPSF